MSVKPTISAIEFRRFKSLVNETVHLRPLTILTGENSAGKSSVIQAIRLLSQATQSAANSRFSESETLTLVGTDFNLGTWQDLISDGWDDDEVGGTIGLAVAIKEARTSLNDPRGRVGRGDILWALDLARSDRRNEAELSGVQLGYFRDNRSDLVCLGRSDGPALSLSRRDDATAWHRTRVLEDALGWSGRGSPLGRMSRRAGDVGTMPLLRGYAYSNSDNLHTDGSWSLIQDEPSLRPEIDGVPLKRGEFVFGTVVPLASSSSGLRLRTFVIESRSMTIATAWVQRFWFLYSSRQLWGELPVDDQPPQGDAAALDGLWAAVVAGYDKWLHRLNAAIEASLDAQPSEECDIWTEDLDAGTAHGLAREVVGSGMVRRVADARNRLAHGMQSGEAEGDGAARSATGLSSRPEADFAESRWPPSAGGHFDHPDPESGLSGLIQRLALAQAGHDGLGASVVRGLEESDDRSAGVVVRNLERASDTVEEVLSKRVHYLGPLRSVAPFYSPTAPTGGVARLGPDGEYTAAVLAQERETIVVCPTPDGGVKEIALEDAVALWLQKFGVAGAVASDHVGKAGVSVQFRDLKAGELRDPTALGVGASQLLPVIVLCLLAQPGDVVLIEQPELHLHPKPQQILGDFLIAVAKSGRQVIAETHSDHVVNRIRRRTVEGSVEAKDLVRVLFAQRVEAEHGSVETHFVPLDANEFGMFDDWPEGFFDEARDDLAAITRAAATRARKIMDR